MEQPAGCETVIYTMKHIFQDPTTTAVLVDATNTFTSILTDKLPCKMLQMCLYPSIALTTVNTYHFNVQPFIGQVIYSKEGTTQGDSLAVAMYAIATLPSFTN